MAVVSNIVVLVIMLLCSRMMNPCFSQPSCNPMEPLDANGVDAADIDMMQFPINLEFLEAEFFLWSALGYGLDVVAPQMAMGGPPPIGARKANLDRLTRNIITEFAYQEVGHLRALNRTVGGFPRPLLNLSASVFAKIFDDAFGFHLVPPFNPYRDSLSYMLASYVVPYVGLVGYVGTNPNLKGYRTKLLLAGLLGVEAGQDAVIRTYLYERLELLVLPYALTVAEFTTRISDLRNRLAQCGLKDEGLVVPQQLGAETKTKSNILSANYDSISYRRTPAEILRIVYGSGHENVTGDLYPNGGNGKIAKGFLAQR